MKQLLKIVAFAALLAVDSSGLIRVTHWKDAGVCDG